MDLAKKHLEKNGKKVLCGFISPSSDCKFAKKNKFFKYSTKNKGYVQPKLIKFKGNDLNNRNRSNMIQLAIEEDENCKDWVYLSEWECSLNYFEDFPGVA